MNPRSLADYRTMMSDSVRMDAYRRAISQVCPGKTVCEIGVGLGPLTLLALKAGATKVYGIEADPDALSTARRVIADNGFARDRFVPLEGLSLDLDLPEPVDVLLCELFDSTGFAENVVTYVEDARHRFLKPGGITLPRSLDCYVALATPDSFQQQCEFWIDCMRTDLGLDYSAILATVRSQNVSIPIRREELVSDWERWLHVEFADPEQTRRLDPVLLQVSRPSVVSGVAMVFDVELACGIHIRTFPEDPTTHWQQGFSPFANPVACRKDDCLWLDVITPLSDSPYLQLRTRNLHLRGSAALKLMADLDERRRSSACEGALDPPRPPRSLGGATLSHGPARSPGGSA